MDSVSEVRGVSPPPTQAGCSIMLTAASQVLAQPFTGSGFQTRHNSWTHRPLPISLFPLHLLLAFCAPAFSSPLCLWASSPAPETPARGKYRDSLPGHPPGQSAPMASNNLSYFVDPHTGNDISWPIMLCAGGLERQLQVLARPLWGKEGGGDRAVQLNSIGSGKASFSLQPQSSRKVRISQSYSESVY